MRRSGATAAACAAMSGSSAGKTANAPAPRPAKSSPLARATSSIEPSVSRCAAATLVMTPIEGRAISVRVAISPRARIAISRTHTASVPSADRIVSGRPTSVLKLPGVRSDAPSGRSAAAQSSLVVVLPFEPVIATTRPANPSRTARARSPSARRGSSTAITARSAQPAGTPRPRATTTPAAPAAAACAANAKPSTRSPGSAK